MSQLNNKFLRGVSAIPFLILTFFCASALGASERNLLKTVPDSMDVVIGIDSTKEFLDKLENSPIGEIFYDETLAEFFAPMREKFISEVRGEWDEDEEAGVLDSLETLFDGQFIFMMSGFDDMQPSQFAFVAEFTGTEEQVSELLAPISDESKEHSENTTVDVYTEEVAGMTLHIEEVNREGVLLRKNGWSLADGVLVIAHPYEFLKELAIRQTEEAPADSLVDAEHASEAWGELRENDVYLYADIGKFATAWEELMLKDYGQEPDPMLNMKLMFEKLRLDNLGVMTAGLTLGEEEDVLSTGIYYEEQTGIVEILAYEKGDLPRPEFVKATCLSSSVSLYSFARCYDMVRDALGASPMMEAMLNNSLQMLESQVGFNVEEALIDSLGTTLITYSDFRSGPLPEGMTVRPADQLFMLELKDAQRFERVLESIISMYELGMYLEKREFLGYEYREQIAPQDPLDPESRFGYTITDQYLIINIGSTQLLEHVLGNKADKPLWEEPVITKLVNRLPPNPSELNYTNLGALLVDIFQSAAETATLMDELSEDSDNQDSIVDLEALPQDFELPVASLGALYITEQGIRTETHFIRLKEEEE